MIVKIPSDVDTDRRTERDLWVLRFGDRYNERLEGEALLGSELSGPEQEFWLDANRSQPVTDVYPVWLVLPLFLSRHRRQAR